MGSLSLLQGIFPTQGSNWGLLHCRLILYQLSYQGTWNMVRSAWLLGVTRECASRSESWRIRGGGEGTFKLEEISMCSSRLPSLQKILSMSVLGRPRGMRRGGRREGGLGWGTHVNPWLIHVNVWQKPLQYCKVISLQLIKINEKKMSCSQAVGVGILFMLWILKKKRE